MKKRIIPLVKIPDSILSKIYLKFFQEKNSLLVFTFHGIFLKEEEIKQNIVDPQTWVTLDQFQKFVEYYLNNDYEFISPNDILKGLDGRKQYVMITFDDGYYNNKHVLTILKKYKIPAVFFLSSQNIEHNKCFWWDVLYRERIKTGKSKKEILKELNYLKTKTNEKIEEHLIEKVGIKSFKPKSDIDRPFKINELKDFSKEKYVFIGNHTKNHGILTNYPLKEVKSQRLEAQTDIERITGIKPIIISYPNGNYSDEIIEIVKDIGIKIGLTMDHKKNYLPLELKSMGFLRLGRFIISGNKDITKQCRLFRSDILLYTRICRLLNN